jgi:hypothetical protein
VGDPLTPTPKRSTKQERKEVLAALKNILTLSTDNSNYSIDKS